MLHRSLLLSRPVLTTLATLIALAFVAPLSAQDAAREPAAFRIVSPDWVAQHAPDPDVRILDVRTDVAAYQQGHVPGAVHLANDVLRGPVGGLPVQYLGPEPMAAVLARAGIGNEHTVVVYADGEDVVAATMVAYCLQRIGHRRTAIMDGGLGAYARRHPLTQAYPDVRPAQLQAQLDRSLLVTLDELRQKIGQPGVFLLDTRSATAYLGNTTRWIRNGHIPGAVNLDWHHLMQPGAAHTFRSLAEIRRLVTATGVAKDDEIVVYCGTSREATLVFLLLRHVLGYPNMRLYEGSWTEYSAKPDLPVEREPRGRPGATAIGAAGADRTHRPPAAAQLEPYQCGDVARLHTYQGVFLASQPSPADFAQAQKGGIRTVVNLRHASETKVDDEAVVRELGLRYHNPAWNGPEELTDAKLAEVRELLRTAERPLLLYCASANRVGAMWLAYRVLDTDLDWERALQEAKTVGLKSPAYEQKVQDYVRRQAAPAPRR